MCPSSEDVSSIIKQASWRLTSPAWHKQTSSCSLTLRKPYSLLKVNLIEVFVTGQMKDQPHHSYHSTSGTRGHHNWQLKEDYMYMGAAHRGLLEDLRAALHMWTCELTELCVGEHISVYLWKPGPTLASNQTNTDPLEIFKNLQHVSLSDLFCIWSIHGHLAVVGDPQQLTFSKQGAI